MQLKKFIIFLLSSNQLSNRKRNASYWCYEQ